MCWKACVNAKWKILKWAEQPEHLAAWSEEKYMIQDKEVISAYESNR